MQESKSPEENLGVPEDRIPEGWTKSPSVEDLNQDFNGAASYHDSQMIKVTKWNDNLNITGSALVKKRKGRSSVQPKLIRKHAEWRYAALSEPFLATSDMFKLRGRTHQDKMAAQQNQALINYQWDNQLNKVKFIDEYIRTGVDEGTVFVRVGWKSVEETVSKEVPIYDFIPAQDQNQMVELQEAMLLKSKDSYAYEAHIEDHIKQAVVLTEQYQQPIIPVLKRTETVEETVLTTNAPTVDVCNTANIRIDPSCNGEVSKAEFLTYSFETSKSELLKDGRYFNIDKIKLAAESSILAQPDHEVENQDSFNFKDDARQKFVAYEYWGYWDVDGSGKTTPFVATWVGNVMIRLEENPFPDSAIPFVCVPYLPVRKSVYGEPDGVLIEDNQKIIGAVTRGSIDIIARSANGQKGMRKDALDAVNKRKYELGQDYSFNPQVDPRQAIIDHVYPEIPNSVSFMLGLQNNDAESLTGVKPYSGGLSGDTLGETATAVRGVLDAASKREMGILRRFANGMVEIANKIIAMNAVFLSDEEVIRVTDEEFVAIRREDLAGNFDIVVDISTAEEDNAKAQELSFMLQTMGNSMPQDLATMILTDIARLRKMPQLAKRLEDYEPQPDPIEQEKAMLEIEMMKAEIMEKQAEAQERMAKAQKAMSDAGKTQSDKDLADLDYVETESGIKHDRELEKHGAQAKANIALEIVKADVNPKPTKVS